METHIYSGRCAQSWRLPIKPSGLRILILSVLALFAISAVSSELQLQGLVISADLFQKPIDTGILYNFTINNPPNNTSQNHCIPPTPIALPHKDWKDSHRNFTNFQPKQQSEKSFHQNSDIETDIKTKEGSDAEDKYLYLVIENPHIYVVSTKKPRNFFQSFLPAFDASHKYQRSLFFLCYMFENEFDDTEPCLGVVQEDIKHHPAQMDGLEYWLTHQKRLISEAETALPAYWVDWYLNLYNLPPGGKGAHCYLRLHYQGAWINCWREITPVGFTIWPPENLLTWPNVIVMGGGLLIILISALDSFICAPDRHQELEPH